MKNFKTVASLKLARLTAGQTVLTQGYYVAGDGGGGAYLVEALSSPDTYGDHALADGVNQATLQVNKDINAKQYGITGDGTTDDTAALQAANDRIEGTTETLYIDGTPLVTSTIVISSRAHWRFSGAFGVNGSGPTGPWSFIKKDDSMTTEAVRVENSAKGVVIEGGGIEGVTGNGGDGLVILGNSTIIRDFAILNMGQDGIRIGQDAAGANANNFYLDNVYSAANIRYGFHLRDAPIGEASNANAGQLNRCHAPVNGSHGFYANNIAANTLVNFHAEGNTGWGVYLDSYSEQHTFIGGDVEGNTAGDIFIQSARHWVEDAADNGSGLIRITIADTSLLTTGDVAKIADIVGTTEANDSWTITVIDGTNFDLQGSTFSNAYTSGGTVNNYAGSHKMMITYGTTFTDNGYLTSNLTTRGSGKFARGVGIQGTWTPTALGSSTAGTPTYGGVNGRWQLNGDMCTLDFDITITATTGMVGLFRIGNLPFAQADNHAGGALEFINYTTFPTGTTMCSVSGIGTDSFQATFTFSGGGVGAVPVNVTGLQDGGNTRVRGTMIYKALTS